KAVGVDRIVAVIAAAKAGAGVDVCMNVYEAGCQKKALGIDSFCGVGSGNGFFDGGDFVVSNGDVADFVKIVFGIEDGGVLEEQIVFLLREEGCSEKEKEKNTFHGKRQNPLKRFNTGDGEYCRTGEKCHGEMKIRTQAEIARPGVNEWRRESQSRR